MRGAERRKDSRVLRVQTRGAVQDEQRLVGALKADEAGPDADDRLDVLGSFEHDTAVNGFGEIRSAHLRMETSD